VAAAYPDAAAIVEEGNRTSYSALLEKARAAAGGLIAAGVEPGDSVALWAPNSAEWIVAMLGVACAGAVLVPLNTRYRGAEAAYILNRSRATVLVTVDHFLGHDYKAMLAGETLPHLQRVLTFDGDWPEFVGAGCSGELLEMVSGRSGEVGPDDRSDLMFTSGTTGAPKGVPLKHGPTVRSYRYYAANLGISFGDRYLLSNPLFHTFGSKAGVVAAMTAGAALYPVPVFDASSAAELIARDRITVFPGPPTVYHSLLALPAQRREELRSLRLAVTGAAAVPVELLRRMREELGFDVVLTAYGLTETTGLVTMCRAGDSPEVVSSTSGRAIPGVEVRTVDPANRATRPGEPGEIVVRGYPVTEGYFEDEEATAEAIDSDGWLHTGDVGILDESGGLKITDRIKDMFIVGGFNAYPAEIEAALMEFPGVAQVAVVGMPDERLGEVGLAFVIVRRGESVDPDELIGFAGARMANYKVPRRVEIVEELPLNASGKVLKNVLRQQALETRGVPS
jgi:acyl-CoA synthetase (AMP-forming)/AMP-acid ligase II